MSSEQVKLRLAPAVACKLRALAAHAGVTVSDFVTDLVNGNAPINSGRALVVRGVAARLQKAARAASGKRY